jgi:hypothetical protein
MEEEVPMTTGNIEGKRFITAVDYNEVEDDEEDGRFTLL